MAIYNGLLLSIVVSMTALHSCTGIQFGRCNETFFLTKAFQCEMKFFATLASNSAAENCSTLYNIYVKKCYENTLVTCFRDTLETWRDIVRIALLTLEAFGNAQFYCTTDEINYAEVPEEIQKHFPCSNEYLVEGKKCTEKLRSILAMHQVDRVPLCREYAKSMTCTADVTKIYCNASFEVPDSIKKTNGFCSGLKLNISSKNDTNPDEDSGYAPLTDTNPEEDSGYAPLTNHIDNNAVAVTVKTIIKPITSAANIPMWLDYWKLTVVMTTCFALYQGTVMRSSHSQNN